MIKKILKSFYGHPVSRFIAIDTVLRFVPLAFVHRGFFWAPWGVFDSPGFVLALLSDAGLGLAVWYGFVAVRPSKVLGRMLRVPVAVVIECIVFTGLLLIVADGIVYAISARHLHQIPANNLTFDAFVYTLKVPQYAKALAVCVLVVLVIQGWLIRRSLSDGTPAGRTLVGTWWRAAVVLLSVSGAAWTSELATMKIANAKGGSNAGSTRPVLAITSSLMRNDNSISLPMHTAKRSVVMTSDELDLVASIGLPARPRDMKSNPAVSRLRELPPKVILITVESLGRNFVRKLHIPHPEFTLPEWVTPSLDKLAGDSVSFNAHGTTMMPTQPGLYTTLLSRCVLHDRTVAPQDHRPLAEVLRDAGYEASYFQGAEMGYGRMDYYSQAIFRYGIRTGYHEILASGPGHRWGWGLHDDVVFDAAWKSISADLAKRQFVHILTMDTHAPFGSEQEFTDAPTGFRGADPMFRALYATDRAIGRFLKRMEATGLMDRGALVIVTTDHSPSHWYSEYMPDNPRMLNDRIPLFIKHRDLAPGSVTDAITSRMSSQIDVAPTVVSLMGLETPQSWAGRNLFDPATRPLWVSNEDPIGVNNQTVEFKLPDRVLRIPFRGEISARQGDPALGLALQKWLQFKYEESLGESRSAPEPVPRLPGTTPGPDAPALLVKVLSGGIRILRPVGERHMPRVDERWAGGPIILGGMRQKGVTFRVPGAIVVEVPVGSNTVSGQIGVMPSRMMIQSKKGDYEWKVTGTGGTLLKTIKMSAAAAGMQDFRVTLPSGAKLIRFELRRANTGDRFFGYDEGFIGGLSALNF